MFTEQNEISTKKCPKVHQLKSYNNKQNTQYNVQHVNRTGDKTNNTRKYTLNSQKSNELNTYTI